MNAYMNQYQNNQILSASPEQILILLYDGSIRFCRQAIHAMDEGNRTMQAEKISKAMAIVCEFANTLNHEVGGEIATDLDALYAFMARELTRANLQNDREALETVEDLLTGLRATWVEAIEINRGGVPQAATESTGKQAAAAF